MLEVITKDRDGELITQSDVKGVVDSYGKPHAFPFLPLRETQRGIAAVPILLLSGVLLYASVNFTIGLCEGVSALSS